MLFKLLCMAGSSSFFKKTFLGIHKLNVIYLINAIVVILETHTRCHWLYKVFIEFFHHKSNDDITSSVYSCRSNLKNLEGDEIK